MQKNNKITHLFLKVLCLSLLLIIATSIFVVGIKQKTKTIKAVDEYSYNAREDYSNTQGVWGYYYGLYNKTGSGTNKSEISLNFAGQELKPLTFQWQGNLQQNCWRNSDFTFIALKNESYLQILIDPSYQDYSVLVFTAPYSGIIDITALYSMVNEGVDGENGKYYYNIYTHEKSILYSNKGTYEASFNRLSYIQQGQKLYFVVDYECESGEAKGSTSSTMAYVNFIVNYIDKEASMLNKINSVYAKNIKDIKVDDIAEIKDVYNYLNSVDKAKQIHLNKFSDI